jgi:ABC-2 type transport system permease protein
MLVHLRFQIQQNWNLSMKKLLNIALKDLKIMFRDPSSLVWMLAMPIALTLAMAFAFGRLTGGGSTAGLSDIPVIIVDLDGGQMSQPIVQTFQSAELSDLITATLSTDVAAARTAVEEDKVAAAVIIPAGFTEKIIPAGLQQGDFSALANREQGVVEVYASLERPISASIVRSIVNAVLNRMAAAGAAAQTSITQLIMSGAVSPQEMAQIGNEIGMRAGEQASQGSSMKLTTQFAGSSGSSGGFDWMAYMAPSMAVLFLMFTVSLGARSVLAERQWGTLQRLLTSPTSPAQVLGGKLSGIFLTGLAQMVILIVFSTVFFGVRWGAPVALLVLIVATVFAASGWGALIAAYAKSPGQAMSLGSMMALLFAGLAGNFVPRQNYPEVLQKVSLVTPNAWAVEGFEALGAGGDLQQVLLPVAALTLMGVVLFAIATVLFRRQYR